MHDIIIIFFSIFTYLFFTLGMAIVYGEFKLTQN